MQCREAKRPLFVIGDLKRSERKGGIGVGPNEVGGGREGSVGSGARPRQKPAKGFLA